jgi:hypothetical protein
MGQNTAFNAALKDCSTQNQNPANFKPASAALPIALMYHSVLVPPISPDLNATEDMQVQENSITAYLARKRQPVPQFVEISRD